MGLDRRSFLQMLAASAAASTLPASIARALAIPANNKTGSIKDVEHVVFMMQENRSFDHYFGTLRGVRGFGDPRAVTLPTGRSVFHQPVAAAGYVLPFHPTAANLGLQFIEDLPHDWTTTQLAANGGRYDQWVTAKTASAMAYLERADIPYHYALADAFTVCDAYHASLLGPTDPNRYHMFSGWVGNDGRGGGPVIDNAEAGYSWSTFPEVLEAAGISWKVYQDIGSGLDAAGGWGNASNPYVGNYGDNSLLFFNQYRNALPGSALYEKARRGTNAAVSGTIFDHFRADAAAGTLPQVSYVVAPEAYSEHPNWPANYGAYYVSEILDALTANPDLWSKTVFFIMYDENDGFFDHMVPPMPPTDTANGLSNVSTANEVYPGTLGNPRGPYGLGPRVPMIVVSPWSKGGWVDSEVFDHTSLIRFVARCFGTVKSPLLEPNITAWRSAVCGDLTSAFDFATPNAARMPLPDTDAYVPPDAQRHPSYVPLPPVIQSLPPQEPGVRPARAVPYACNVSGEFDVSSNEFRLTFKNAGRRAAVFHVRSANPLHPPRSYTLAAGTELGDSWAFAGLDLLGYRLEVYGPNGFYRSFAGSGANPVAAHVQCAVAYEVARGGVSLGVVNRGKARCELQIVDVYTAQMVTQTLAAGAQSERFYDLAVRHGWYDFKVNVVEDPAVHWRLAGHLETGRDSMSDPALGKAVSAGRAEASQP